MLPEASCDTNAWMNEASFTMCKERGQVSFDAYQWLLLTKNLSKAIADAGADFNLERCCESFSKPFPEECHVFSDNDCDDGRIYFVRQVILKAAQTPLIFARVIVPLLTYENYAEAFKNLGAAPIGNQLLYSNPAVKRSAFEFRQTEPHEALCHQMQTFLKYQISDVHWIRRSRFFLQHGSLLITEVFLDDLFSLKHAST